MLLDCKTIRILGEFVEGNTRRNGMRVKIASGAWGFLAKI